MANIFNDAPMRINRQPRGLVDNNDNGGGNKIAKIAQGFGQALGGVAAGAAPIAGQLLNGVPGAAGLGLGSLGGFGGLTEMAGGDPFAQQLALIDIQREVQMETQVVETLSNIEKAQHDARMSAVRNMRP